MCSPKDIYRPHWLVQWSYHCSCMYTPVHSPWLPGYINVTQTILIIINNGWTFSGQTLYINTHTYSYIYGQKSTKKNVQHHSSLGKCKLKHNEISLNMYQNGRDCRGSARGLAGLPWVAAEVLKGYFSGWGFPLRSMGTKPQARLHSLEHPEPGKKQK